MSERANNLLLDLLAALLGLGGIYVLADALLFGGGSGWGILFRILAGVLILAIARGFKRRKGAAFLAVSVGLLIGWMVELIRAIVIFEESGFEAAKSTVIGWLFITLLIGYLGRWSMERRFRPHLDVD